MLPLSFAFFGVVEDGGDVVDLDPDVVVVECEFVVGFVVVGDDVVVEIVPVELVDDIVVDVVVVGLVVDVVVWVVRCELSGAVGADAEHAPARIVTDLFISSVRVFIPAEITRHCLIRFFPPENGQ